MCSLRDVKHKTMSKSTRGLPQESWIFLCDTMEMYGSNNCFTLKLPSETVPPWHDSLCGEMAFFRALLSHDSEDVHPRPNWNSDLQMHHADKPWSHCDQLYSYFTLCFGSFCQLVVILAKWRIYPHTQIN